MTVFLVALWWLLVTLAPAQAANGEEFDFLSDDFYEQEEESVRIRDPLEGFNRAMFVFNDRFYFWVLEPVATGYSAVAPKEFRWCVSSFFNNLEEPIRFVNTLLQGRFADSVKIFERFAINTTLGVYGLADVAAREFDIRPVDASLGQTFGRWGIDDGFYLVVPFMGPSTLRDFTGTVIDNFGASPYWCWTNYQCSSDWPTMMSLYSVEEVNEVSLNLGKYEEMKELTLDPYVALKNAYFQRRPE